jgi:hypothetical protein
MIPPRSGSELGLGIQERGDGEGLAAAGRCAAANSREACSVLRFPISDFPVQLSSMCSCSCSFITLAHVNVNEDGWRWRDNTHMQGASVRVVRGETTHNMQMRIKF